MCKLQDGVANSEVIDVKERAEEHVGQALEYACRSWHKHLVGTIPAHITLVLHRFLKEKFFFWLEVLNVLGAAKEAVEALGVIDAQVYIQNTPADIRLWVLPEQLVLPSHCTFRLQPNIQSPV